MSTTSSNAPSSASATPTASGSATQLMDGFTGMSGWSEAARWAINAVVIIVVVVASAFFYYRYRKLRRIADLRHLSNLTTEETRRATEPSAEDDLTLLDHEQLAILPVSKYDPDKVRNSTCPICLEDFEPRRRRRHSNESLPPSLSETDMTDSIISKPASVASISRTSQPPPSTDNSNEPAQASSRPVNRLIRRLPCGHGFCVACIDPWLTQRSRNCPICKRDCTTLFLPTRAKSEYSYEDSRHQRCASPTHSPSMLSYSYYRCGRPQDDASHMSIQMDSIAPRPDSLASSQLLNDEAASLGRPQSVMVRQDNASEEDSRHHRSLTDGSNAQPMCQQPASVQPPPPAQQ
ncbi:hypothetical protein NQZ79_g8125 [Umbelopsis isabellina]|nr:hypothetical protein NQZ79_g8125 [Umbelopsis isabellina]